MIIPDLAKNPISSDEDYKLFPRFNMTAPMIAIGSLVSNDIKELAINTQHFHSFSLHNEGGHYVQDVTPDSMEYLGYFNVAESIYRIDKPVEIERM